MNLPIVDENSSRLFPIEGVDILGPNIFEQKRENRPDRDPARGLRCLYSERSFRSQTCSTLRSVIRTLITAGLSSQRKK